MEAILQEKIVKAVLSPFHDEVTSIFDKLGSELTNSFQANAQRRSDMHQRLVSFDEDWNQKYEHLKACIQGHKVAPLHRQAEADPDSPEGMDKSPGKEDSQGSGDAEPDWEALLTQDHAQSVARIERFLDSRQRWQEADEKFRLALEDIHARMEATTETILNIAVNTYDPWDDALGDIELELQTNLVDNYQRRQALAAAVEEKAKEAQNVFARLMARVKLLGGKRKRGPGNA